MRLIDTEVLIEKIVNTPTEDTISLFDEAYRDGCATRQNEIIDIINDAPTVDAVPVVHAQWVEFSDFEDDLCFMCSNCLAEFSGGTDMRDFANYCPHCGAKMDGKKVE